MKCPRCESSRLDERERDGVIIDACPQCRGVWLDRGELEKLVSRAAREMEAYERSGRSGDVDDDRPSADWRDSDGRRRPERKRSWLENLGEIFD